MHYSDKAFSKDKQSQTIVPPKKIVALVKNKFLNRFDIIKINKRYKCYEDKPECTDKSDEQFCKSNGLCMMKVGSFNDHVSPDVPMRYGQLKIA